MMPAFAPLLVLFAHIFARSRGVLARTMQIDYTDVTELAGRPISQEQLARLHHRYTWAASYCEDRDVVEVGCGTGPGLGLLQSVSRSVAAGDIDEKIVAIAQGHYGARIPISRIDAQYLPFEDRSKDVVLLFEAIYYLPDADRVVRECARVRMRVVWLPGGVAGRIAPAAAPAGEAARGRLRIDAEDHVGETLAQTPGVRRGSADAGGNPRGTRRLPAAGANPGQRAGHATQDHLLRGDPQRLKPTGKIRKC
jgi:SAM-dependent methyltransferase